jgi:hypothetical protein
MFKEVSTIVHVLSNHAYLKHARSLMIVLIITGLSLAIACGSSESDSGSDSDSGGSNAAEPAAEVDEALDDARSGLTEVSRVMFADKIFTAGDYSAVGWKQNKKYDDISTVPEATEVYFGFYNARDIEVRVYESHDFAATAGFDDAAADIDQSFAATAGRSGLGLAVRKFKAFTVVGNTVLLCEFSLDICVELATAAGG